MRVAANGVTIDVEVAGDGPAVLLLHGWPDTHRLWRECIGPLQQGGSRVIAPDLRGFGRSSQPTDVAAYSMLEMLGDVVAVLDATGVERAHVVGHDWGAALAWVLASVAPDRVHSLCAVSVGHPAAFKTAGMSQREKSWYMLLFQFADVAEDWLSGDGFANFRAWSNHPDADEVAARFADRAALTASLGVYRANLPPESLLQPPLALPPVQCPTLGLIGDADAMLTVDQMEASGDHVAGPWRCEVLPGIGHWVPLEAPDQLVRLVLDHAGVAVG